MAASSVARSATAGNNPTITLFSVWEAQGDWANLNRTQIGVFDPALTFGNKMDAFGLFHCPARLGH